MRKSNLLHWFCIFLIIFLLVYLPGFGWRSYQPLIIGIPFWVWYVVALTILLSIIGGLFARNYDNDSDDA